MMSRASSSPFGTSEGQASRERGGMNIWEARRTLDPGVQVQEGGHHSGVCVCVLSREVMSNSFATSWTVVCQALLSIGFPRREYWSGLPFPPPGNLLDPGIKHALAGRFFTTAQPRKPSP